MNESEIEYDPGEFNRERRAAKNRMGEIDVGDITTREITHNGEKLTRDDLRVLAVVVEEEESLDTQLGLYVDGVSASVIRDLMDYGAGSASYRFRKLEDAGLITVHDADDLPVSGKGMNPTYAVPTEAGRRVVDELSLVPILTRDRDLEEQFDMLASDYMELRESHLRTLGRQALLVQQLSDDGADDLGEFSFDALGEDLVERGESVLVVDLPSELSFSDEYAFGKLLGEMDGDERELMLRELLDDEDGDSDGGSDGSTDEGDGDDGGGDV